MRSTRGFAVFTTLVRLTIPVHSMRVGSALIGFLVISSVSGGATEYNLTPLPPIPGEGTSYAYAINNSGEIVGISQVSGTTWIATVWTTPGTPSALNPLPDGSWAMANSVNNAGEIVGTSQTSTGQAAVIWNGSNPTPLGSFGNVSSASGINAAGQVVGLSGPGGDGGLTSSFATIWNGSMPTALQPLNGNAVSAAVAINNSGQVVGNSGGPVVWNGTTPTQLDALGAQYSYATGINNAGTIVGWGLAVGQGPYGIVWDKNTLMPTQLVLLSQ